MTIFHSKRESVSQDDHPLAAVHWVSEIPASVPPPSILPSSPAVIASSLLNSPSVRPLTARTVQNNRDGGLKYVEALDTLITVLKEKEHQLGGRPIFVQIKEVLVQIREAHNASQNLEECAFLTNLLEVVKTLDTRYLPKELTVRERNATVIKYLRQAIETPFYQQHKGSNHLFCNFVQELAHAKIAKVYPYETFKELVSNAAKSNDPQALSVLEGLNKGTVGPTIRQINLRLQKPAAAYKKSWFALLFQKLKAEFGGMLGLRGDPGGESNVPYVRSQFKVRSGEKEREIQFCRFGTPTIQESGKVSIDPILLATLDAMGKENKQFLYVNHQKLEGTEGVRAKAIARVEQTHANFHFLSIPMDGPIVGAIKAERPIDELKTLIAKSFTKKINGCVLPQGSKISHQDLHLMMNNIHASWFPGQTTFTKADLEAFWGIFNTVLKHAVVKEFDIDAMNSACKDTKDRGGTFGTIDEAVRNVLLGVHEDPARLQELVFNALAPFMIKLEHILDNPQDLNHHRLGYLISVLNHIATLTPLQIDIIQKVHAKLCFDVVDQQVPRAAYNFI